MATAVLDTEYLSAYLSVPQQTLTTVIDAPTAELVRSVLDAVQAKAREHDELAADKLRVDIELENAVRSAETRVEGLRSTIDKSQKTVEELRTKLKEEGSYFKYGILEAHLLTFIFARKRAIGSRK
jgi:nucleoprotein TPR